MGQFIQPSHLAPFATIEAAKATEMIADAEAMAILAAPCLPGLYDTPDGETEADRAVRQAKLHGVIAILRGAILRWNEAGTGALAARSTTVGPFGQSETIDTRQQRRSMFWPSEIAQLQSICAAEDATRGKAYAVDTVGGSTIHAPTCSLMLGAAYCSCGTDIAGRPIFDGAP